MYRGRACGFYAPRGACVYAIRLRAVCCVGKSVCVHKYGITVFECVCFVRLFFTLA